MRQLLAILIVFGLLAGQSESIAAAICHHHSAREHLLARQSHDVRVAAGALGEETAASVVAKKGALSGNAASSLFALADLLPRPALVMPKAGGEQLMSLFEPQELIGISVGPLLRPPHA